MRLTRNLRRLLDGYVVALAVLAGLGGLGIALGGILGSWLGMVVWWSLFLGTFVWLVIAYYAGASPSTYLRPDADEMVVLSRSGGLILPQDNPAVMSDLEEKLVGGQSDSMLLAGGNAALCFGLSILFFFIPLATVVGVVVAVVVIGSALVRTH